MQKILVILVLSVLMLIVAPVLGAETDGTTVNYPIYGMLIFAVGGVIIGVVLNYLSIVVSSLIYLVYILDMYLWFSADLMLLMKEEFMFLVIIIAAFCLVNLLQERRLKKKGEGV